MLQYFFYFKMRKPEKKKNPKIVQFKEYEYAEFK